MSFSLIFGFSRFDYGRTGRGGLLKGTWCVFGVWEGYVGFLFIGDGREKEKNKGAGFY